MALNVAGVAVMMLFYLLVLGIGIWASIKSRREAKRSQGDKTEMALLGNRGISLVVGIFTMTGLECDDLICCPSELWVEQVATIDCKYWTNYQLT